MYESFGPAGEPRCIALVWFESPRDRDERLGVVELRRDKRDVCTGPQGGSRCHREPTVYHGFPLFMGLSNVKPASSDPDQARHATRSIWRFGMT
jgi:hypothetical protein